MSQQLVDINGNSLSNNVLTQYMSEAVTEYSRWRPLMRQFGVGGLATNALAASTTILAVGGPFAQGQQIYIDAFQPYAETATIASVTPINPAYQTLFVGTPVTLELEAPTSGIHYAGADIAIVNASNSLTGVGGLNLNVGQVQYPMPLDWVMPEENTWALATGQKTAYKKYQSFYDSVYEYSSLIQDVDLGEAQNFVGAGFPGFIGVGQLPGGALAPIGGTIPTGGFIFTGAAQTILNVTPAPQSAVTLAFNYYALHQPETVNPKDMDAIVAYGIYLGVANNAVVRSVYPDLVDIRQQERFAAAAANCRDLAKQYLDKFDTAVRLRPYGTSG
jgi:hypothetical protein